MSEIQRDLLTKIAMENWSKSGDSSEPKKQFDPELVKEIYETELLVKERQKKTVPLQRVMILEVSQYLENDLWPNFDPELEHVMLMMLMINKKERELSIAEKTNYLVFMINAFQLRGLALANSGAIYRHNDLNKILSVLFPTELKYLVCQLKLVSTDDPWSDRVDFLIELTVSFFEKQQSQKEAINVLLLYPNEQIIWDESVIPSINYSREGCLPLPKLNLQFLILHDYLLRNFNLFRLESTYEIREDIRQAVPHLLAYINNEGETACHCWSRMAVPIKQFKIAEV